MTAQPRVLHAKTRTCLQQRHEPACRWTCLAKYHQLRRWTQRCPLSKRASVHLPPLVCILLHPHKLAKHFTAIYIYFAACSVCEQSNALQHLMRSAGNNSIATVFPITAHVCNKITEQSSCCRHLALSTNNIEKISSLTGMDNLKILSLGRNCIKKIENLDGVADTLEQLWMSYNQIEKLVGVEKLANLQVLYLANNKIKDWSEVERLSSLEHLEDLLLKACPIYEEHKDANTIGTYRVEVRPHPIDEPSMLHGASQAALCRCLTTRYSAHIARSSTHCTGLPQNILRRN